MKAYLNNNTLEKLAKEGRDETPVIFLDRDGVINKRMPPHQHVTSKEELEILPGVYEALRIINSKCIPAIVITNQRSISIGTLSDEGFRDINDYMIADFRNHGVYIDGIFYCPHGAKDGCMCRKPKVGLFEESETEIRGLNLSIDKMSSWIIGDENSDIEAGMKYGVNAVYVGENANTLEVVSSKENQKILMAENIIEAINKVVKENQKR